MTAAYVSPAGLESSKHLDLGMKKLNFIVTPYRDRYFLARYGNAVRDLHMIQALTSVPDVAGISVINRPVTVHERVLLRKRPGIGGAPHKSFPGVEWIDRTDTSLFGPLRRRRWLEYCYRKWEEQIAALRNPDCINVLLDFTPLSKLDYKRIGCDVVWYDAIDNFTRHNRFSRAEIELVRQKYSYVSSHAQIVSGVAAGAVDAIAGGGESLVLPNGLPADEPGAGIQPLEEGAHDFGFMGFVTDKFDINLARSLSAAGYTIGVFGDVYDAKIKEELQSIPSVRLSGAFTRDQAPAISRKFKVGLIPYLKHKLHDESPLKLYQYLSWGKPVLSSVAYEVSNRFIEVYAGMTEVALQAAGQRLVEASKVTEIREEIAASIGAGLSWKNKIRTPLEIISSLSARGVP